MRWANLSRLTCAFLCALLLATLPSAAPAAPLPEEPGTAPDPRRTEVGGLPVLAYDSDTGLLLGGLVAVARFEPGAFPYAWRLQALLSASVKREAGGLRLPLHGDSLSLDVPGLREGTLRISADAYFSSYRDAGWYGPGGDSSAAVPAPPQPPLAGSTDRYHSYGRVYPGVALNTRWRLWERAPGQRRGRLEALVGGQLDYSHATVEPGSLLDQELALARSGSGPDAGTLRGLLHGTEDHLLTKLRLGLLYDSRDQEFQPTRGLFLEASVRLAPAPASLRHAGFFASAIGFLPLWDDRLVLGGRAFADAIAGDAPFYALTEAGVATPTNAPGGATTLRGVLSQRYAGKLKLVASAELRAQLFRFSIRGQRFRLGALALADAGRAWADWHPVVLGGRDVDGRWTRFATGIGGGLRLAWGETLLIRADQAWSPSDGTQGLYIDVGNVF